MGWGRARLSFMATGGKGEKGTLEVNTPHRGDPSARPSLSLERPVAHAVCRPHPQAVEGDFTFVTIIHLIGFQLSGRGSGGCVSVSPPSCSAHQREHKKMTNGRPVASGRVCPLGRWTGLGSATTQTFLVPVVRIPLDSIQCPGVLELAHRPGAHLHGKTEWGLREREHGALWMLPPAVPCGFSVAWRQQIQCLSLGFMDVFQGCQGVLGKVGLMRP